MECSGSTARTDGPVSLRNHGQAGLRVGPIDQACLTATGSAGKVRALMSLGIEFTALDGPSAPMPILLSESGGDWTTVSRSSGFEAACRRLQSWPARWYWRVVRRVESAVAG